MSRARAALLAASNAEAKKLVGRAIQEVTPSRRDFLQYVATQRSELAVIARISAGARAAVLERARACDISDLNRKYGLLELAGGNVMFAATGVTDGTMLRGVRRTSGGAETHSIVMRSKTGTVRLIEAHHNLRRKSVFEPVDR